MRFAENKAFPHPVLSKSSDDYVAREFQAAFRFAVDEETRAPILRVKCTLSDETLEGLVLAGRAGFAIETYCSQTFLRRIDKSRAAEFQAAFAPGDLHGRVELNAFVVCDDHVSAFRSPNFNPEFGENAAFDLKPGNVLAVQAPVCYWWDVEQIRPIGAVFALVESAAAKPGSFLVSWEEDKIQIGMRKDDKDRFAAARMTREQKPTLLMSVYFPALMETLRVMTEDSEVDHSSKKWFHAIRHKLGEKGLELSPDKTLSIAQELLGMPLNGIIPRTEK